jgi:hypothetical protein
MKKALSFALLLAPSFLGCNGQGDPAIADREAAVRSLGIERKYLLRDCLVRVDLLWSPGDSAEAKESIAQLILNAMREATIVTRELPLFSGHTVSDRSYFVFYYTADCERREELTKRFLDEFVKPKSKTFPKYSIVSEGIEPGFDGVLPSGAWLPEES